MIENNYLVRLPLLDPKQNVVGYKLAWQKHSLSEGDVQSPKLLNFVAQHIDTAKLGFLFLDASPAVFGAAALNALPPADTVLMLNCADLVDEDHLTRATLLRSRGFKLALCDADLVFLETDEVVLSLITHLKIDAAHPDLLAMTQLAKNRKIALTVVVDQLPSWQAFDARARMGVSGFFKNLCATPRPLNPDQKLSWQAILLLQLMQLVQDNADIQHLEKLLNQDASIAERLLGHLNSARFGLGGHIASVRQAVTMLGYKPLFRWLSLLLVTTCTSGFCPAMLQTAIIRGRFIELLGQGRLPKSEVDSLFIVGIFSLLDQLLEIPVDEIFSHVVLPDTVLQALRSYDGVYGPYLALAVACESEDGDVATVAKAMGMDAERINQAHFAAIVWAQSIKL